MFIFYFSRTREMEKPLIEQFRENVTIYRQKPEPTDTWVLESIVYRVDKAFDRIMNQMEEVSNRGHNAINVELKPLGLLVEDRVFLKGRVLAAGLTWRVYQLHPYEAYPILPTDNPFYYKCDCKQEGGCKPVIHIEFDMDETISTPLVKQFKENVTTYRQKPKPTTQAGWAFDAIMNQMMAASKRGETKITVILRQLGIFNEDGNMLEDKVLTEGLTWYETQYHSDGCRNDCGRVGGCEPSIINIGFSMK